MPTPLAFDQAIADEICERIAQGQSLRSICGADRDDFLPGQSTVFKWLAENDDFAKQYARAREAQADAIFDEILDIADDARNDWMERLDSDGQGRGWAENGEHVQRSRIRIDARRWMAGKLQPKKYGDKLGIEHSTDEALRDWLTSRSDG